MKKLKELKIDTLALVNRGANKVNNSVLKADVSGNIFKVESSEEAQARKAFDDPKEFIKSSEILHDICGVYEIADGKCQDKLGEIIKHYNGQLPELDVEEPKETKLTTASELLEQLK